ncbi:hypothetical protein KKE26_01205 [bacterium]|nr:hypothetical protein [bacterium]
MNNQEEINSLREQIDVHKKNLRHLELQKAKFGNLYLPPYLVTNIEDEKNDIQRLIKEIQGLEQGHAEILSQPLPTEMQTVNISGSQNVNIIQSGRDVYHQPTPALPPAPCKATEATTTTKAISISDLPNLLGETEIIFSKDIAKTPKQAKFDNGTESYFGLEINYDYMNPVFPALFQSYINLRVPAIRILLKNSSDAPFTHITLSYNMHNIIDLQRESIRDILNPQDSISKEVVLIAKDPNTLFRDERAVLNLALKIEFKDQYGKEYEWAKVLQPKIASKNSFIWKTADGKDCSELIAAFITPHDPAIKTFLGEARELSPNREVFGYGKDKKGVLLQVKAIYETLKEKGIGYVDALLDFSGDQSIKLPSQILADKFGNCVDLSLLFASICEAISINPIIICIPEHMFFGFEASRDGKEYFLLETTFVGNYSFEEAIKEGREIFNNNRGDLLIIDITKARDAGIFPIML